MTDESITVSGQVTRKGLYLPVMVCHPGGADLNDKVVYLAALIDTGAEYSAISTRIAAAIDLPRRVDGGRLVSSPTGIVRLDNYSAGIALPSIGVPDGTPNLDWLTKTITLTGKANASVSTDLLLGMDLLSQCRFELLQARGWTFQFNRNPV